MRRTVIIGGGEIGDCKRVKSYIRNDDYIICADGGYDKAKAMGLNVNLLLGDFDSISKIPEGVEKVQFPVRKDLTDSHIALEYAKESDEILLFGFTGDRADHSLTNMLLLDNYPNAVIIDDNNEIRLLKGEIKLEGRIGQTVSVIPINGDLIGVTTKGLDYPLKNETLYFSDSRGVSNVMTDNECEIECKSGTALVIKVEKI